MNVVYSEWNAYKHEEEWKLKDFRDEQHKLMLEEHELQKKKDRLKLNMNQSKAQVFIISSLFCYSLA